MKQKATSSLLAPYIPLIWMWKRVIKNPQQSTVSSCPNFRKSAKICPQNVLYNYKAWKDDYDSLLTRSGLQSLNERRKYLKLCYLYQIIHGHFSCTTAPVYRDLKRQLRNSGQHHLYQSYARTSSYQFSFFPHTISLWNSLPFAAHSCDSLQTFKKCLQLPLMQI